MKNSCIGWYYMPCICMSVKSLLNGLVGHECSRDQVYALVVAVLRPGMKKISSPPDRKRLCVADHMEPCASCNPFKKVGDQGRKRPCRNTIGRVHRLASTAFQPLTLIFLSDSHCFWINRSRFTRSFGQETLIRVTPFIVPKG